MFGYLNNENISRIKTNFEKLASITGLKVDWVEHDGLIIPVLRSLVGDDWRFMVGPLRETPKLICFEYSDLSQTQMLRPEFVTLLERMHAFNEMVQALERVDINLGYYNVRAD